MPMIDTRQCDQKGEKVTVHPHLGDLPNMAESFNSASEVPQLTDATFKTPSTTGLAHYKSGLLMFKSE